MELNKKKVSFSLLGHLMKSNEFGERENKSFYPTRHFIQTFANLCDFLVVAAATTSPANWPRRQQNDPQITKKKEKKQVSDKCRWLKKKGTCFFVFFTSKQQQHGEKKIDAPGRYLIHFSYSFFLCCVCVFLYPWEKNKSILFFFV